MKLVSRIGEYAAKRMYKSLWDMNNITHDPKINNLFFEDDNSSNYGYVKSVKGECYIEPKWGYIISNGALVYESMVPNFDWSNPVWKFAVPSKGKFHKDVNIKDNVIHVDKVILLRHFWDWNYYHFYFDVLGKLKSFDDLGVSRDIPVVLGKYVDEISFPRQVINAGRFKDRNWLITGEKYVHANEVLYCRHRYDHKNICEYLVSELEIDREKVRSDRIYLSRGKSVRSVKNESEIINILDEYNFKIVDTNGLNVSDQIEIFRNARYVVAPHGAGITNILFRSGNPLSLLELHPIHAYTDFKKICDGYGYDWDYLMGVPDSGAVAHANYSIDPNALRKSLSKLIDSRGKT